MREVSLKAEAVVQSANDTLEGLPQRLAALLRPNAPRVAAVVGCIHIDSPLILLFALVCVAIHSLDALRGGVSIGLFAVGPWASFKFLSPLSYW